MRTTVLLSLAMMLMMGLAIAAPPSTAVDQLLANYYTIHRSLAADSVKDVSRSAGEIQRISRDVAAKEAHAKKQLTAIADAAGKLKTSDLKSARDGFSELSERLIVYLKASGTKTNPPYQFYCSMLKKNWLQPDKAASNPYYGSEMPKCGELVQAEKAGEQRAQEPMGHHH